MRLSTVLPALAGLLALAACGPLPPSGITLYQGDNWQGPSTNVVVSQPDLANLGFNDRARSIEVFTGEWKLCSRSDYRGACETFRQGRHRIGVLAGELSSVEEVGGGGGSGAWQGNEDIVLYAFANGTGGRRGYDGDVPNLVQEGFNDNTQSVKINRGRWQLCTDVDYRGDCRVYGPGEHRLQVNFDKLSSFRRHGHGHGGGGWKGTRQTVTLYEERDGRGRRKGFSEQIADLDAYGLNDRARSVKIRSGRWTFCTDAWFQGTCRTYGPGDHNFGPNDRRLSSFKEE